jgi:hypothetical protein
MEPIATDNSRADALTDENIESMAIAHGLYGVRKAVVQCVRDLLAASPVEQHEAAPAEHDVNQLLEAAALGLERAGMLDCMRIVRGMKPGYPKQPAPSAPLEGTGNGADERAAFPRYTEWMHLRKHGEWSNGVPDWARDHTGRMNDFTAASAVIEELASRAAASQPAAGQNTVLIDANIDLGRAVAACTQEVFLDASQPAAAAGQEVVAIVTETHEAREKPDLYTIKAKARLNIGDRLYTAPLAQVATRQEFCAKDISDLRAGIDYAEAMGYLKQERAEQLRALLEGAKQ